MRLLFIGDIVGRPGRDAVARHLPSLKAEYEIDFTIINAENAAHGFGLTEKIAKQLFDLGADCLTTGNHIWDQREMILVIDQEPRILRPCNFTGQVPGRGHGLYRAGSKRVLVINAQARLFMEDSDNPFFALNDLLQHYRLGRDADAIFVDFHGEASSEKMAMGHYLDGRVSAVIGTHTHIPTADAQIFTGGTAYQTDAGMTGDYDSVIGMKKGPATQKFLRRLPGERLSPASSEATLCGVLVETDDTTGLARHVTPIRRGGKLLPT